MKISTTLLTVLLVEAKRNKERVKKLRKLEKAAEKAGKDRTVDPKSFFVASDYAESNCAAQVAELGGSWSATGQGQTSGTIDLQNYQDDMDCMHEVVAADSCSAITVTYRDIAVESCGVGCECDQFRFGWTPEGGNEELQSTSNCHCNHEQSCDTYVVPDSFWNGEDTDFSTLGEYEEQYPNRYGDHQLKNDGFSVNTNRFKFYFYSDSSWYNGHVVLDWACVEDDVTTDAMTTTEYVTSRTTTTDQSTTYPYHTSSGYDTTTTTEYYPDYGSTTTTETTTTTYSTTTYTQYDSDCNVRLVYSGQVCNEAGTDWKNDDVKEKWTRLATYKEAKSQQSSWKYDMGTWYIVGLANGYANGPGYGSQIRETSDQWDKPPCHRYGAHLMCLNEDWEGEETTTTTTTWVSTSTSWYDYGTTTTTPYSTQGDDSCYRYHAGFDEFANAVKDGIYDGLTNDIYSYSAKPGTITNGAMMRREQWYGWLSKFVDVWHEQVSEVGRRCLAEKFPYDSPGDLDKERVIKITFGKHMSTCTHCCLTQLLKLTDMTFHNTINRVSSDLTVLSI